MLIRLPISLVCYPHIHHSPLPTEAPLQCHLCSWLNCCPVVPRKGMKELLGLMGRKHPRNWIGKLPLSQWNLLLAYLHGILASFFLAALFHAPFKHMALLSLSDSCRNHKIRIINFTAPPEPASLHACMQTPSHDCGTFSSNNYLIIGQLLKLYKQEPCGSSASSSVMVAYDALLKQTVPSSAFTTPTQFLFLLLLFSTLFFASVVEKWDRSLLVLPSVWTIRQTHAAPTGKELLHPATFLSNPTHYNCMTAWVPMSKTLSIYTMTTVKLLYLVHQLWRRAEAQESSESVDQLLAANGWKYQGAGQSFIQTQVFLNASTK